MTIRGKLMILDDGKLAWDCPGCGCMHAVNDRWQFNGNYDKPTFSPSVKVTHYHDGQGRVVCHCFVRDGQIQYLSDCYHEMAGQTVDLPDPC